jgi:hypothetical protein
MKLRILYHISCVISLALTFTSLPSYASEVDELYAEIETILSLPNGSNILKEKASELSEELVIATLDKNPERVEKATFLMRYADPAPNWDAAVSNLLASEETVNITAGLSIMGVHGTLGDATEDQLTTLIADPASTTILSGAARIAGRASLTEVIPLLRKELWSDDIERNTAAILGLIEFGPNASYLIPDLERKLRQIDQVQGSASEQGNYLSYIPRADKAGNLKNLLEKAIIELTPVSTVTDGNFVAHVEQQVETITPQTSEATMQEPAKAVVAEPIEEDVEQSSNWWLWLIGAVVVVGGTLVLRPKKSGTE